MRNYFRCLLVALVGLSAPLAAQTAEERIEPSPKELAAIQALTPNEVASRVIIEDDDLETVAKLTTAATYKSNGKFTDRVRADNFFRAFISKQTGQVNYQLYQTLRYSSAARNFTSVNYATPDGPRTAKLEISDSKIDLCYASLCSYADTLAFEVPAAGMKQIAAGYVAGNSTLWRFKFRSRTGIDWEDRISPAEAAGLLIAVEKYLNDHPRSK